MESPRAKVNWNLDGLGARKIIDVGFFRRNSGEGGREGGREGRGIENFHFDSSRLE